MRAFLERRPLLTVGLRDLRSSYSRFVFVIAAMALGIAALVAVRGSAESVRRQFLQDTRALLGADLVVQSRVYPSEEQQQVVANMSGVTPTLVFETMTMASSTTWGRPQIADVTVVNPAKYPLYGEVVLNPRQSLAQALGDNSVAVSPALLLRLHARVGDKIQIAGQEFRIAAVLVSQPDRLFNDNPMALPILMSKAGFARTTLMETGRRMSSRYLFKLQTGSELASTRSAIEKLFPGTQITDFKHGKPELSEAVDRATAGLSMICLFALVLACAGLAMTMRSHLRERMDAIATMKSLGATFRQVLGIYLLQIMLLAIVGSLVGIAFGFGLEILVLHFARNFFSHPITLSWTWQTAAEGLVTGVFSTLLLTLPVLIEIRTIKPLLILRRDFEPESRRWHKALVAAPIVVGLGLLAAWLSASWMIGEYFLLGLTAAIVALAVAAKIVIWAARKIAGASTRVSFVINYAIKGLSRPGNQTIAVLVALGISSGFTLGVFLIQRTILQELSEKLPETIPSLILAGVTKYELPGLTQLLRSEPQLKEAPEFVPMAQVRLVAVDGKPIEELLTNRRERRLTEARPAAGVDFAPAGAKVTQGAWWHASDAQAVAVREDMAQLLHLHLGSQLSFQIGAQSIPLSVAAIYKWQERSLASSFDFMLPLHLLADVPVLYVGGVRVKTASSAQIEESIYRAFPTVTIFNLSDILGTFEAITNEMTLIVKSLAAFVIVAGLVVLAASVTGDRMERAREIVFLKSIGATRGQIIAMLSVEFLILGVFAGGIGATFASSFASLLARRLFQFTLHTEWGLLVGALGLTAALAITVGWLASYRVLRLRPNEALR